jgi:hypothetical protein
MKRAASRRARAARIVLGGLAAIALILLHVSPGRAADGRDFAGLFKVDNPTDAGDGQVQVTLTVQIFNYSGADVSNATVTLQDSINPGKDFGAYPGAASIFQEDPATLSHTFNISPDEYSRWQQGAMPIMRIDYQNAAGEPARRQIELAAGPIGE